ncbi:MAG: ABC transporter permease, partial [Methyloligellaceae bacterium]
MTGYIFRRLLLMIPTLLVISAIVFLIIELPPGDYLESYVAELESRGETVDDAEIQFLREQYGFGEPVLKRYVGWVTGMVQGDFGYSFEYRMPVSQVVGDRLFLTILISV